MMERIYRAASSAMRKPRWRCGDADATAGYLREGKDIAARGPMPLFMTKRIYSAPASHSAAAISPSPAKARRRRSPH